LIIFIIFGGVQIIRLLTMYDSPTSCHLFVLRVEYCPNYPVVRHILHNPRSLNVTKFHTHSNKVNKIIAQSK
jgi:hypothetical protein